MWTSRATVKPPRSEKGNRRITDRYTKGREQQSGAARSSSGDVVLATPPTKFLGIFAVDLSAERYKGVTYMCTY